MSQVFSVSLHTSFPLPFSLHLHDALLIDSPGQESPHLGSPVPSSRTETASVLCVTPAPISCCSSDPALTPQGLYLSVYLCLLLDNGLLKGRDIFRKCLLNGNTLPVSWSLCGFSNSSLIAMPVPLKSHKINRRPQA